MEHQVAGDKTDVVEVIDVACGRKHKQVVDHHDQQDADHRALGQVLVIAGGVELHRVPYPQRGLYGPGGLQAQVDVVAPRRQLHRHDEVAMAHRALGERLFVAQAVLGAQGLACKVVKPHIVQEGVGQFDEARHWLRAVVVQLKSKPVAVVCKTEIGGLARDGLPSTACGQGLLQTQHTAGVHQNPHAGAHV